MVAVDTCRPVLSGMVDDCCQAQWPVAPHPGPLAALRRSEVLTLAIFGPWQAFGSERGFDRSARRPLRAAFPRLPTRAPFTRHLRRHPSARVLSVLPLGHLLAAPPCPYAALDSTGVPTRDATRRGLGWLPGLANNGWRNRRGGSEGVPLLLAGAPGGVITGLGFGPASTQAQRLAETLFARRRCPPPQWRGAGAPAHGPSVADQGCAGVPDPTAW